MTVDEMPKFKLGDWVIFDPPRELWGTVGKPSYRPCMVVDFDPSSTHMVLAYLHSDTGRPIEYVAFRGFWRLRR